MSERVPIAIVGCGGMGRRHLTGIAALYRTDFRNVDLVAVCDLNLQNAEDLADEAGQQLGARPRVFGGISDMVAAMPQIRGVDIVTDAASHHRLAVAAFEAGLNVLCEKPLALTIRGCNAIIAAAASAGRVLSVAENYRRDPMNRLIRALIDDGAIGTPRLALDLNVGGGDRMIITPWRHRKLSGTIVLDAGVHNADILQYYLGGVESVYGEGRLFERYRRKGAAGGPGGFYAKWFDQVPDRFEADGDDAIFGYLRFASGAIGQWTYNRAGFGQPFSTLQVFGSKGSITSQGHRNGKTPRLFVSEGQEVTSEGILEYAPSYRLAPVAAALFGGERPHTYSFPFAETDAKILALEYHEFAECVRAGTAPEVDGAVARHAVAIVNGLLESGVAGRALTLSEVEAGGVDSYQREIDQHYGLA